MRYAECHPDKRHHAKGLCKRCYNKPHDVAYREAHREALAQKSRLWRQENPVKVKEQNVRNAYGISVDEYNELLAQKCAICGGTATVLDHDHETNKIRGALCDYCNKMLGFARDDPAYLVRAAEYLQRFIYV